MMTCADRLSWVAVGHTLHQPAWRLAVGWGRLNIMAGLVRVGVTRLLRLHHSIPAADRMHISGCSHADSGVAKTASQNASHANTNRVLLSLALRPKPS